MGFFRKVEDEIKDVGRKIDDEVFQPIGKGGKKVVKAVADVGRKIDDEILQPIADVGSKIDDEILQPVKDTVEAIVEDPKKLAAVAIAVAFPGAGAFLGAQLGITSAALAQVVGQTIINTALNGGDVKSAVISAALPVVGQAGASALSSTLASSGIEGAVNTVITRAVSQGATAAALGKDPLSAFVMGGATAGLNAILPDVPGYNDLPDAAKNAVNSALVAKLAGKDAGGAVSQSLINDAIDFAKKEVAAYRSGSQSNTLTDADVAAIAGGGNDGTYTGVNLAGPGEGSNTGTFVPSWMSLAGDERIVETRLDADGATKYVVERINPNNPEQFTTYEVSRDPETGKVYYASGGMDATGNMTVTESQKKPTVDWEAEEGSPASTPDAAPPIDDFIDKLVRDDALFGDKPETTVDELIKDLAPVESGPSTPTEPVLPDTPVPPGGPATPGTPETPTTPPVTPVEPTPPVTPPTATITPAQVEKIVSDALKANPSLTAEDVQGIVSDAIKTIPNLTAEQVKTIVGEELAKGPTEQYNALTAAQQAEADARVAQGQTLQDAITGVAGQVTGLEGQLTQQGKDFALALVQQGMDYTTALQTAIDAQSAMFGSQIGGVQSQLAAAEAQRQADLQAQLAREQAAEQARVAQAAQAAAAAKEAQRQAAIRTGLGQGQQQLQQIAKQIPQAFQQAQTTTTPIYGEMGQYLDLGSPLDFDFFKPSPEKQAATKQQQPTKIAAGGYIDDLLAGDMTVDELLNLLR